MAAVVTRKRFVVVQQHVVRCRVVVGQPGQRHGIVPARVDCRVSDRVLGPRPVGGDNVGPVRGGVGQGGGGPQRVVLVAEQVGAGPVRDAGRRVRRGVGTGGGQGRRGIVGVVAYSGIFAAGAILKLLTRAQVAAAGRDFAPRFLAQDRQDRFAERPVQRRSVGGVERLQDIFAIRLPASSPHIRERPARGRGDQPQRSRLGLGRLPPAFAAGGTFHDASGGRDLGSVDFV